MPEWRPRVSAVSVATTTTSMATRIIVSSIGTSVDVSAGAIVGVSVDGIAAYVDVSVDVDVVTASTAATVIHRSSSRVVPIIIVVVAQGNAQCCRTHCRSRHAGGCAVVNLLLTRGGVVRLTTCRQSQCDHWSQQTLK